MMKRAIVVLTVFVGTLSASGLAHAGNSWT